MKKLISLFAIFSMLISLVSVAHAETVNPTLSVELVGVPETIEVGSTFQVKVTYKDIPTSENDEDWAGVGFNALQFKMQIPGYGTNFTKNGKTYHTDPLGTAAGSAATKNLEDSGLVSYGYAGGSTADTIYRVGAGDVYVLNLKVLKVPTEDVVITLTDTAIKTVEFDAAEKKVGEQVYQGANLNVVPATIKFGEDKPEEPQITINNKYVFNFTADAGQEVMVKLTRTNGIESDLTYSLPELVKGEASIFGLLKVTDNTVVSGDKFDISVVDADRNPVKAITTITVD